MKNKIGFIAIGQAGSNIGKCFESKGYQVLYLNTSKEDLDISAGKNRYKINGADGCNKDRDKSKKAVINDFENIYFEIEKYIKADLVYITFGSGGGTGSGCSCMLTELLINNNKNIGIITVLPSKDESIKTHMNSYECFKELNEIEGLSSVFIIDNDKGNKIELNNKFANLFDSFVTICDRHHSIKGNIDKAEILETLSTSGMSMIISGTDDLISNIDNNIFAPREIDNVIKYIAISKTNSLEIKDLEAKTGKAFDTFVAYNDKKNICCLSGLSYPITRIDEMFEIVKGNRDSIKKTFSSKTMRLDKSFDFFGNENKSKKNEIKNSVTNKDDIFAKYMK